MPCFLFPMHCLRYNCLKVTRFYFSLLLHKQLPLSIRAISKHRRKKKEKSPIFVILSFNVLRLAEKFPSGSFRGAGCVYLSLMQAEHVVVYPLSLWERNGKNVPPDQPDWFSSDVSLLRFRASVLLPYELDSDTK